MLLFHSKLSASPLSGSQGGITLGLEQGELGANFSHLGFDNRTKIRSKLTFTLTHTMPL